MRPGFGTFGLDVDSKNAYSTAVSIRQGFSRFHPADF